MVKKTFNQRINKALYIRLLRVFCIQNSHIRFNTVLQHSLCLIHMKFLYCGIFLVRQIGILIFRKRGRISHTFYILIFSSDQLNRVAEPASPLCVNIVTAVINNLPSQRSNRFNRHSLLVLRTILLNGQYNRAGRCAFACPVYCQSVEITSTAIINRDLAISRFFIEDDLVCIFGGDFLRIGNQTNGTG